GRHNYKVYRPSYFSGKLARPTIQIMRNLPPLRHRLGIGIVALLGLVYSTAPARAQIATAGAPGAPATRPTTSSDSKFLRFVADDRGGGVLQASVVTYRNAAGQTVDLIGAVHIAEPSF